MIKKIELLIGKLGQFNHAFVSLVCMIPLYFIFGAYEGATVMSVAYYFREIAQAQAYHKLRGADAYNPWKWMKQDRIQQTWVVVITYGCAFLIE